MHTLLALACLFFIPRPALVALGEEQFVQSAAETGSFPIVQGNDAATLYVDPNDWVGLVRAAGDLQADINPVTGQTRALAHDPKDLPKNAIIIGTLGKSPLIDQLIHDGKIDATQITGKWESFFLQVVPQPLPGVDNALVIIPWTTKKLPSDRAGDLHPGFAGTARRSEISPSGMVGWAMTPSRSAV